MQKLIVALSLALLLIGCQDTSHNLRNYPPPADFRASVEGPEHFIAPPGGMDSGRERRARREAAYLASRESNPVPAWNDKTPSTANKGSGFAPPSNHSAYYPSPTQSDPYAAAGSLDLPRRGERWRHGGNDYPAFRQRGRFTEYSPEAMLDEVPRRGARRMPFDNAAAFSQPRRFSEPPDEETADFSRYDTQRTLARADADEEDWAFGQARGLSRISRLSNLPPGFVVKPLNYGGRERSYLLYVPPALQGKPQNGQRIPLVMVFHGGGGNAVAIARTTNMHQLAEQYGFIVVYPNGTSAQGGRRLSWNAGSSPPQGYAENQNIDDVGFVKTILGQLRASYAIDPTRIYATGFSKGGMFTYRLGCEMSEQFAAIAPVSGALTYSQCRPTRPIPLLHIHGDNDESVPLKGGRGAYSARMASYPSILQNLDRWRQQNHCDPKPLQTAATADTQGFSYQDCTSGGDVTYYIVRNGGHAWPGATLKPQQQARGIHTSNQFRASEIIWRFFAAHPKP